MRLKSGYRRILFHLFPTSSIGPIDPEPEVHSELESLFLMSMRLSQLRDSIHFTPFFSLTYLHTKYFQTRKKINPSEFNVNEIKYWSQKDPFSSLSYQLNRSYIITRTLYIIIRNKF